MKLDRVAAAPISWGVCEVTGWGKQLEPSLVLEQMRDLGLTATEFGPVGFLPANPSAKAALLEAYGLQAVGGFLPVLLHEESHDPLPVVDAYIDGCLAAGADTVVLAAHSGGNGYDSRPLLDDAQWKTLLAALDKVFEHAGSRGVVATLHPHVGTLVESAEDVRRVLERSSIGLCLDTGHLLVGGTDPLALAQEHADRIAHVHLKDVDATLSDRVLAGDLAFGAAVAKRLFRPFGTGDVDIAAIVGTLEAAGYDGWYVLEQDVMLADRDVDTPRADVATCLDYLKSVPA